MDPSSTPLTQPTGPFHMAWYARPEGLTSVTVLVFFSFLSLRIPYFVLRIQVRYPSIPFPSIYIENKKKKTYK